MARACGAPYCGDLTTNQLLFLHEDPQTARRNQIGRLLRGVVYAARQQRDKEALEQMVSYAVSGFCRWKLLFDYFRDEVDGVERCCRSVVPDASTRTFLAEYVEPV